MTSYTRGQILEELESLPLQQLYYICQLLMSNERLAELQLYRLPSSKLDIIEYLINVCEAYGCREQLVSLVQDQISQAPENNVMYVLGLFWRFSIGYWLEPKPEIASARRRRIIRTTAHLIIDLCFIPVIFLAMYVYLIQFVSLVKLNDLNIASLQISGETVTVVVCLALPIYYF